MAGAGLGPRMDLGRTWNVRALFTWSCPAGRARKAMADQRFPAGKGQMLLVGGGAGRGSPEVTGPADLELLGPAHSGRSGIVCLGREKGPSHPGAAETKRQLG